MSSVFALVAGALITVQVGSNTELKKSLDQPLPALLVNYILGFTAVLVYTLAKRVDVPAFDKAVQTPWWGWLSGCCRPAR